MERAKFSFNVNPCEVDPYVEQVSAALEKRTELVSRAQHPKMWARTDRKNEKKKNKKQRWYTGRGWALTCIILGVILFIPGILVPKELMLLLVTGTLGILVGVLDLRRGGRLADRRFDTGAKQLLKGKQSMMPGALRAEFVSDRLRFAGPDKKHNPDALYKDFECMIETEDTLLMVFDGRVLLLLKNDIYVGSMGAFRKFIGKKMLYCKVNTPKKAAEKA